MFPWSKASWSTAKCTCSWVRGILITDPGELERGSASLFRDAVQMPTWVCSTWLLGGRGDGEWYSLSDRHYCAWAVRPKELAESKSFPISLMEMVSLTGYGGECINPSTTQRVEIDRSLSCRPSWSSLVYRKSSGIARVTQRSLSWRKKKLCPPICCWKVLKQRRKKPKPRFSILSFYMFCNTNTNVLPWDNALRKMSLQNTINFWQREWRKLKKSAGNGLSRNEAVPFESYC